MEPLTETIPKTLLEVNGQPFAAHQLRLLVAQGFTDVLYCVGHLGERVEEFVGDGSRFGIPVGYAFDGAKLRGTAGALRGALDADLLARSFAVVFGDGYLPIAVTPMWDQFEARQVAALMAVYRNMVEPELNNVVYRGNVVKLYSKCERLAGMHHIDFGLSIMRRDVVERYVPPREVSDLADLMRTLSLSGQLGGFEVSHRYYEVGSKRGLRDLEAYLAESAGRASTVLHP
jgi:NDP-sugar pyrophosphorylase family protein